VSVTQGECGVPVCSFTDIQVTTYSLIAIRVDPVGAYTDLCSGKSCHRLDIVLQGNTMKLVG
jgi:hypothetical protein